MEILPGEMGNIMLPRIDSIDADLRETLLDRIDAIVRADDDIKKALDIVDQTLMVNVLGISAELCASFRRIWKKMQRRRLTRG